MTIISAPRETTQETINRINDRDESQRHGSNNTPIYDIISEPNGQQYGKEGHIPCNHKVIFWYTDGIAEYNGERWIGSKKPY